MNYSGDTYEGEYKYGYKRGEGILKFRNGEMYKGGFKDDLYHGKGMYTYIDNSVYQGDFENGSQPACGVFRSPACGKGIYGGRGALLFGRCAVSCSG